MKFLCGLLVLRADRRGVCHQGSKMQAGPPIIKVIFSIVSLIPYMKLQVVYGINMQSKMI